MYSYISFQFIWCVCLCNSASGLTYHSVLSIHCLLWPYTLSLIGWFSSCFTVASSEFKVVLILAYLLHLDTAISWNDKFGHSSRNSMDGFQVPIDANAIFELYSHVCSLWLFTSHVSPIRVIKWRLHWHSHRLVPIDRELKHT